MSRPMMRSVLLAIVITPALASAEHAPIDVMKPVELEHPPSAIVNTHILFLNNCQPNGCVVKPGQTDSTTDHSDIVSAQSTLSAFPSNVSWASVKSCIEGVMAPFNITVTDTDPGTAPHFEVMIAGTPQEAGLSSGVAGIADYPCGSPGQCSGPYISNALVFDFASAWSGNIVGLCGTAAQEIAHAWTLDHTTLANDPMTYKNYASTLKYQDNAPCGSDCDYSCSSGSGTCNAFNVPCTGTGTTGTHTCLGSGQLTQNEVQTITALFGPSNAQAPTVAITAPTNGALIQTGNTFPITATCTTSDGIQEIDLSIDGAAKATLTASPAMFMGPNTLAAGTHQITVACATKLQASAAVTISITVGSSCNHDTDCPANDICFDNACIAGPSSSNGLGAVCTQSSDCASLSCGSDGTNSYCVIPCDPSMSGVCPGGFSCLATGASGGVCWPGDSGNGGGCNTGGNGSLLMGLGIAAMLVTRKRRGIN